MSFIIYAQNEDLKGIWEVVDSLENMSIEEEGGMWWIIDQNEITTLVSFGGGIDPQPMGPKYKYSLLENQLVLSWDNEIDTLDFKFIEPTIVSLKAIDNARRD